MLIKNCMLIDGADIFEEMKDIRIVNGKIKEVADCLMPEGDEGIIDAEGAGPVFLSEKIRRASVLCPEDEV